MREPDPRSLGLFVLFFLSFFSFFLFFFSFSFLNTSPVCPNVLRSPFDKIGASPLFGTLLPLVCELEKLGLVRVNLVGSDVANNCPLPLLPAFANVLDI